MEEIKDISTNTENATILALLSEIEGDDDELKELETSLSVAITRKEDQAEEATSKEPSKSKAQKLKEDRLRIQRFAFSQNVVSLSSSIPQGYIKMLISDLVQEHTYMVNKYEAYINKRLTLLLRPFIPKRLKICFGLYPASIKACPGFMYRASKEYGEGLLFWATPNIPYYLGQGTEQEILLKHQSRFLYSVDKAVSFYHRHVKKKQDKSFKYASIIIQNNVRTYFDLLKLNPFWFETLYNKIAENK